MGEHSPKPMDRMAGRDTNCSGGASVEANSAISGDDRTPSLGRPRYSRSRSGGAKLPARGETNPITAGVSDPSTGKALIDSTFCAVSSPTPELGRTVYIRVTGDGAVSVRPTSLGVAGEDTSCSGVVDGIRSAALWLATPARGRKRKIRSDKPGLNARDGLSSSRITGCETKPFGVSPDSCETGIAASNTGPRGRGR